MRVLFSLSKKFQEQIEKDKDKEMDENDAEMPDWTGRTSLTQNYTILHNSYQFFSFFKSYFIPISTKKIKGIDAKHLALKSLFYQSARRAECKNFL